MRLRAWLWLALSSISIAPLCSAARPHYGGTLTVDLSGTFPLDAASMPPLLAPLVAETLTRINARGDLEPGLATAWQAEADAKRWRISLRSGVLFHDGEPLNASGVESILLDALKKQYGEVTVLAGGQTLVVQADHPLIDLPVQLASPRFAVVRKTESGSLIGTGPFRVTGWEARRRLSLAAFEDYWGGRPYLDAVVANLGSNATPSTDVFDVPFTSPRRIVPETARIWVSLPGELLALVAGADVQPAVVQALAAAIDRSPIVSVLAQRQSQPAYGVLPQWLSGYEFLFQTTPDLAKARQLAAPLKLSPLALGYPAGDSFARAVADRIALNARDAGITLQPSPNSPPNNNGALRLVRRPLESSDIPAELARIAALLGAPERANGLEAGKPETLYEAEHALLETHRIIPLLHLPLVLGLARRVHLDDPATTDKLIPNLARSWVDP